MPYPWRHSHWSQIDPSRSVMIGARATIEGSGRSAPADIVGVVQDIDCTVRFCSLR
jgi:hypothetical protein